MLSPGQWHKLVRKDLKKNVADRCIIAQCDDPLVQAGIRERCRQDCLYWISLFVWQYNPRKKGQLAAGPFITWDFQEHAILSQDPKTPGILWCIENDEDLLIEKSREMGASWLILLVFVWLWLFHPWNKFLVISRNEDAVDCSDPDSLFWKIDFILERLPDWLMPKGWDKKRHRIGLSFTNPENRSTITGQASTGKAGVGGRATAMMIDEFSQIREDYEVLHRTSDTTGCRIFNGTHKGVGTAFHELSQRVDMKKLVMHWTQHPDKKRGLYRFNQETGQPVLLDKEGPPPPNYPFVRDNKPAGGPYPGVRSPWYDKECVRKGSSRAIAEDLDIDPGGSQSQVFDALMIRQLQEQYCIPPKWEGELHYDRDTARPLQLVPIKDGKLKLWVIPDRDGKIPPGDYCFGSDIAMGTGATPSCLSGIDGKTGEKVLRYADNRIAPHDFAKLSVALCYLFRSHHDEGAKICWECPGPGLVYGKKIVELGYRNVYYRSNEHSLKNQISDTPGWYASDDNKKVALIEYMSALHARFFINRDMEAMEECLYFRYDKQGRVEHSKIAGGDEPSSAHENHGDLVVADFLAWKMAKHLGRKPQSAEEETAQYHPGALAGRRWLAENAHKQDPWAETKALSAGW